MEIPSYTIYCLNYQNEPRNQSMIQRFQQLNLPFVLSHGVDFSDKRLSNPHLDNHTKKVWSNTYGHLDNIQTFLQSKDDYGIMCEDDIVIHKDFTTKIQEVFQFMKTTQTDIVLLSYLLPYKLEGVNHTIIEEQRSEQRQFPHKFYSYSNELWGTQMFVYSKQGAATILSVYTPEYADKSIHDPSYVFSADFTLTKCPQCKRALIYPMLAIEDGSKTYEEYGHYGQYKFHFDTFVTHYMEHDFI